MIAPEAPIHADRSRRLDWLLLVILVVGLALRLRGFVTFPLEGDEIYTFFEAQDLFATRIQPGIEARPLYYLLQHALFWVAPDQHPATLRALPLLFGVLGIWATWRLGWEIAGRTAAAAAACLIALSPWHLYASGMSRYWSLVYLLAALALWRLIVARRTDRTTDYLLVLICAVLGVLSHPTFLFPFVGVGLALLVDPPSERRGWRWSWPSRSALMGFWGPFALFLALDAVILASTGNSGAVQNWGGRSPAAIARLVPAMVQWMTPVFFTAGVLGTLACLVEREPDVARRSWGIMALAGMLATGFILLLAAFRTNVYADYGMASLPLFAGSAGALLAHGFQIAGQRKGPLLASAGVLILAAAMAPATVSHLSDGMRADYRPAFQEIRYRAPEYPVFVRPIAQQHWYAPDLDGRELTIGPRPLSGLGSGERAWVVVPVRRYGIPGDGSGSFRRWLSRQCTLSSWNQGLRFDVRLYRVELHLCTLED